jgi:hypothetical protein
MTTPAPIATSGASVTSVRRPGKELPRATAGLRATLVAAVAIGCTVAGPTTAPTTHLPTPTPAIHTLAPSAKVVKVFDQVSAACAINAAYAGLSPVPQLPDCSLPVSMWGSIPQGSLVTTSSCGEAWLDTDCGKLYVFGGSSLQASTCDPTTGASGSACVEYGTVGWAGSGCDQEVVIATASGSIRLAGTWISATYDRDRSLTLFAVFDGSAVATAVVDPESQTVAEPTELVAGTFWFTTPGVDDPEVAGIPARRAIPFTELPLLVRELHLEAAFASILRQASADGIDVAEVPHVPTVTVRLGGPQFATPEATEAVARAFDWRSTIGAIIGRDDFAAYLMVGDEAPRDLLPVTADAEVSTDMMLRAKLFGATVTWDPSSELDKIAGTFVEALDSMQFAEFEYFDARDVSARQGETAAAIYDVVSRDGPAIWLDYSP